ncbi:ABC transporter substrate-binding protein [Aquibium sp. A9E412]|uniref:ABC transporter substrate-binding protein n=1 Tax=Aquibium sp. A9E412 TaxID=2976767 RepID=UPI0025B181B9|nr:ABC transporter substrate-binding protein [Aquibium sp. A9E412]MDN2566127.1 ABC transporter substrate-binding protein [Aquibium sp. A9E412]
MRTLTTTLTATRRALLLGSALTLAAVLAPGAGLLAQEETPKRGGTLVVGHDSFRHLNSAIQTGNSTGVPAAQIFAGLVRIDADFEPQPYLAESWEIAEDGLSATFRLVEGATFHDGEPITAGDVRFSIETVKANSAVGPTMYRAVSAIETPDPRTVVIRMSDPIPFLLQALAPALTPIIPEHVFGGEGDIKTHPANAAPVGSGPFKFVEWQRGQHVVLERNDDYFRDGLPYLDRIIFLTFDDPTKRRLAITNGTTHYTAFSGIKFADIKKLAEDPDLVVTSRGYEALGPTNFLEFNLRKAPLDDPRVRQAIAHAIDREFITEELHHGVSRPLRGPFHHGNPFAAPDSLVTYEHDLDKARALLDEAGLAPDEDGIRASFTLDVPTFHPDSMRTVAEYLRPQLRKIGLDVAVRISPDYATWASRVGSWEHDMTMSGTWNNPDPVIGVNRSFLCDSPRKGVVFSNTGGYCNEEVDKLLDAAAVETDMAERQAIYAEVQKIVTGDLPLVWTNEEPYTTIYTKAVKNPPNSVWGAMSPMDEVWLAED